ncbi:hypothetical protein DWY25_01040 [Holdemania filiformis]|jgi:hypothetical protein|uniref:Uncharacterized protein n=1 Tax=Holdemania filiformis TaxID=61171 RepID=A0A412G6N4_9FIRM|nr:hypothetical protein DWY25_01040 [Holdemania filiformis]
MKPKEEISKRSIDDIQNQILKILIDDIAIERKNRTKNVSALLVLVLILFGLLAVCMISLLILSLQVARM